MPFDFVPILEKYKISLAIGLVGLIIVLGGIFLVLKSGQSEDKIEIIPASSETNANQKIKADIEGAVIKPGVYELDSGSRVNDLLIMAGGLSAEADRNWVQMTLNLAQKLTDGAKFFIPDKKEVGPASVDLSAGNAGTSVRQGDGAVAGQTISTLININTASASQLDTLYGVGPVTAQKIIDNRPYQSIDDLVTKKAVGKSVFEKIKGLISVY
jgi:competence protein ComEA